MLEEKTALIRHLQTQLRNEEMSLVLLKKIRQSQVLAEQAKEAAAKASISGMSGNVALTSASGSGAQLQNNSGIGGGSVNNHQNSVNSRQGNGKPFTLFWIGLNLFKLD